MEDVGDMRHFISGNNLTLLEISQASTARPYDKSSTKTKTPEWWKILSLNKYCIILI
jgi:hypothetical protein